MSTMGIRHVLDNLSGTDKYTVRTGPHKEGFCASIRFDAEWENVLSHSVVFPLQRRDD